MKLLSLVGILFLVSACAPDVIYKPVSVDIPVTTPCIIKPPIKPVWPIVAISDKDPLFIQARAIVATQPMRDGYEAELEAAILSCQ